MIRLDITKRVAKRNARQEHATASLIDSGYIRGKHGMQPVVAKIRD